MKKQFKNPQVRNIRLANVAITTSMDSYGSTPSKPDPQGPLAPTRINATLEHTAGQH